MISIKNTIVDIISAPLNNSTPMPDSVKNYIFPTFFDHLLPEYFESSPNIRSPNIINLTNLICFRFKDYAIENMPQIIKGIYQPTVEMIKDEFDEYPEFRLMLLNLLSSLFNNCILFIKNISDSELSSMIDCLKWLGSHPYQNISEKAIKIISEMFNFIDLRFLIDFSDQFQNKFGLDLVLYSFELLTDTIHNFAFLSLLDLLRRLFSYQSIKNQMGFIIENLSKNIFSNVSPRDIYQLIETLFNTSTDYTEFRKNLRNFFIQIKQYSPKDPSLFQFEIEELKKEIEEKQKKSQIIGLENSKPALSDDQLKKITELASYISNFSIH